MDNPKQASVKDRLKDLKYRLMATADINKATPVGYVVADIHVRHVALRSPSRMEKVEFLWTPQSGTVWLTLFLATPRGKRRLGFPWGMTKEDARKLWDEMTLLGWE